MPVCMGCAASYGSDFKFCPFCGRAKPESPTLKVEISVSSADQWETCRIENREERVVHGNPNESIGGFWAQAIGPSGAYLAGESPTYYYCWNGYNGARIAHKFLVNQLVRGGWEAQLSSGKWWENQFRRQVKGDYPAPWQVWVTKIHEGEQRFYICRFPENSRGNPANFSGALPQYEKIGASDRIKLGVWDAYRDVYPDKPDTRRILNEFIARLVHEKGFEEVDIATNEELKKCWAEKAEDIRYSWCHRTLLRRIKPTA